MKKAIAIILTMLMLLSVIPGLSAFAAADPVLSFTEYTYIENGDVEVTIAYYGNTLVSVEGNTGSAGVHYYTLTEGTHYTVNGSKVTIKEAFLSRMIAFIGKLDVRFHFSNGSTADLTIFAGEPDLEITSAGWYPSGTMIQGRDYLFNTTVYNGGAYMRKESRGWVNFYVDDQLIGYANNLQDASGAEILLKTGESCDIVSGQAWTATPGVHTLKVQLRGYYTDADSSNNIYTCEFTVS